MRKAIYGLAGLCILLVAFALIIPSLVEWNSYKDLIKSEVRETTGRSLDIAGDVELSFLPMPHIRATDLRLRNAPECREYGNDEGASRQRVADRQCRDCCCGACGTFD